MSRSAFIYRNFLEGFIRNNAASCQTINDMFDQLLRDGHSVFTALKLLFFSAPRPQCIYESSLKAVNYCRPRVHLRKH